MTALHVRTYKSRGEPARPDFLMFGKERTERNKADVTSKFRNRSLEEFGFAADESLLCSFVIKKKKKNEVRSKENPEDKRPVVQSLLC